VTDCRERETATEVWGAIRVRTANPMNPTPHLRIRHRCNIYIAAKIPVEWVQTNKDTAGFL